MKKTYYIKQIEDRVNWDEIKSLSIDEILWTPDTEVRAFGQVCRDHYNIYVHQMAVEQNIRAEYTAPLSPVHEDSCLEFFFMADGSSRYFNFEVNPNGCMHIGFRKDRYEKTVINKADAKEFFDIKTALTKDGWEVFYRIPLSFLQEYYPGFDFSGSLSANMYKCGDKTLKPHFLSWNKVTSQEPDFHRPEDFGVFVFQQQIS